MTKILLLSDIHANLAALEAVLSHAEAGGSFDEVWSLGDAIGYGPQPNECLERVRGLGALAVAGNHEQAALRRISMGEFNPYARSAAQWTASVLTPDSVSYVESMPLKARSNSFMVVHGSPRDPVWEYLSDSRTVSENLPYLDTQHCANGHTHIPAVFKAGESRPVLVRPADGEQVALDSEHCFVNPGSVGQPRDGNPQACYAVLDVENATAVFCRVSYPVEETQSLMEAVGLPSVLIARLSRGF